MKLTKPTKNSLKAIMELSFAVAIVLMAGWLIMDYAGAEYKQGYMNGQIDSANDIWKIELKQQTNGETIWVLKEEYD